MNSNLEAHATMPTAHYYFVKGHCDKKGEGEWQDGRMYLCTLAPDEATRHADNRL